MQIGKYKIEAELGRGGMGRVYRAWDPDMRRPVAIKVLLVPGDQDSLKRFRSEVHTTASLRHKNIVTIHASGEENGAPYLVMELLEGETLGEALHRKTPLTLEKKVDIMTQVAEGLAHAHSKGVVHRDVKPGNIMLLADGGVKIMDFGVALAATRVTFSGTAEGFVVGTIPYMSPEQLGSGAKATQQTDIFGYGAVYYELLTGHHPFLKGEHDFVGLQIAIVTQEPPPVSQVAPECPAALELLVHQALAKRRELRYQEFSEIHFDSKAVLVDLQHARAARILDEVHEMVGRGDLQTALAMARQALQLEPANKDGRQLLQSIGQQLQQAQNRERIAVLEAEARQHTEARQFAQAVRSLEIAAALDTANEAVQAALAEARTDLDNSLRANQFVAEARYHQQKGQLPEALEKLVAAVEIDPDHTDARVLLLRLMEQQLQAAPAPPPAPAQLPVEPHVADLDQATSIFNPLPMDVAAAAPAVAREEPTVPASAAAPEETAAPPQTPQEQPHQERMLFHYSAPDSMEQLRDRVDSWLSSVGHGSAPPGVLALWFGCGAVFMTAVLGSAWTLVEAMFMENPNAQTPAQAIGIAMIALGAGVVLGCGAVGSVQSAARLWKRWSAAASRFRAGAAIPRLFIAGAAGACAIGFIAAARNDIVLTVFVAPVALVCLLYLALVYWAGWILIQHRLQQATVSGVLPVGDFAQLADSRPRTGGRRRAIAGALVACLLLVCWMLLPDAMIYAKARQFSLDVETGKIADLDKIWSQWNELAEGLGSSSLLVRPHAVVRTKLLAALDRTISVYRRGDQPVGQDEWRTAARVAGRALILDRDDNGTLGKLRLCEGHVARISGTNKRKPADLNLALQKFTEAQQLLPESPDPQLGLARLYVDGLEDVGGAQLALTRAGQLGYTAGKRENRLLADGYRERAGRIAANAEGPGARVQLMSAQADYEMALQLYRALGVYGGADTRIASLVAAVERIKSRVQELNPPQFSYKKPGTRPKTGAAKAKSR